MDQDWQQTVNDQREALKEEIDGVQIGDILIGERWTLTEINGKKA